MELLCVFVLSTIWSPPPRSRQPAQNPAYQAFYLSRAVRQKFFCLNNIEPPSDNVLKNLRTIYGGVLAKKEEGAFLVRPALSV